ncbi:hypothetical protein [Puniceibacterium sp. IMCC21224]|uniref:hypothetical protein n=1 Tax=Puniceibacterium sp. IMCC21224 TaxID=1618204 RepID=UPI00064E05B8|nr:hypothetical protein [Puniceibacterium sp. IMCC21224]KMK67813.1 hypothetical protein IMCC21224_112688 [Puniceibacterium sp. IMCC21224]
MKIQTISLSLALAAAIAVFPEYSAAQSFGLDQMKKAGTAYSVDFGALPTAGKGSITLRTPTISSRSGGGKKSYFRPKTGSHAVRLRHLIGFAEASRDDYDSVQHGARTRPVKRPTQMTLAEIFIWIKATPGQPHAIGRYQFIPSTLRHLVRRAGIGTGTVFSPRLQDVLADLLLEDAGYSTFMAGQMSRRKFMHNLAGIWAGLPTSTGRSRYHGYAGNRATISWPFFETEVANIFGR